MPTTNNNPDGYDMVECLGIVIGEAVSAINMFRGIGADVGIRDLSETIMTTASGTAVRRRRTAQSVHPISMQRARKAAGTCIANKKPGPSRTVIGRMVRVL